MISIFHPDGKLTGAVELPTSKSISNRLLILQAQFSEIKIENLSNAEDTQLLVHALKQKTGNINVNHAGSALRFLTAFFAFEPTCEIVISGSDRLHQRPLKPLVDSLKKIGAEITYIEKDGFAPLKIKGVKAPNFAKVEIDSSKSSQFISALLLISGRFQNGLELVLENEIVSKSYIDLTTSLLKKSGFDIIEKKNSISVKKTQIIPQTFKVEKDWSAASFFFTMATLSKSCNLLLLGLNLEDLQGDKNQLQLFEKMGLKFKFEPAGLRIENSGINVKQADFNLIEMPDVTQAISVAAAVNNIDVKITGLQTLPAKESNRILALKVELEKFEKQVEADSRSLKITGQFKPNSTIIIKTYNDHRMAMAFSAIALKQRLNIEQENVVVKSFPNYWKVLESLGFVIEITTDTL